MTRGVVVTTPYLTVTLLSVILTESTRVVMTVGGSVVTQHSIAPVRSVLTTEMWRGGDN